MEDPLRRSRWNRGSAVIGRSPDHGAQDPQRADEEEHDVDAHLPGLRAGCPASPGRGDSQAVPFTAAPSTTPWSTPLQSTTRESQTSGRTTSAS